MKYTIFVAYPLKGNDYTERPNLECCYHLYNSKEEAIKAVANEIECKYNNRHYHRLRVNLQKAIAIAAHLNVLILSDLFAIMIFIFKK